MAAIASAAGVSVQTPYLRHGSKAAILSAALDAAIAGDAEPVALPERQDSFLVQALAESDAARAIAISVHGGARHLRPDYRLYEVIRSEAADPEVAQVLEKNRNERSTGLGLLADAFAKKPGYDPPSRRSERRTCSTRWGRRTPTHCSS
jgi:AcrR family transcriptional regulator